MARPVLPVAIDEYLKLEEIIPAIRDQTYRLVRSTGEFTVGAAKIYRSVLPLADLINRRSAISDAELHQVLDELFLARLEGNAEIFSRVMTDAEFRAAAREHLAQEIFRRVREQE